MSNNKILCYFTVGAIAVSCYLTTVAAAWEDRPDVGFIDHFVHVHLDHDSLYHPDQLEIDDDKAPPYSRFAQDLREYGQGENSDGYSRGTLSSPGDSKD